MDTHYVEVVPVALPLAGDVELVVVSHTPFPATDHTFQAMEERARAIEGFTGEPFPVTDVILLLTEPDIWKAGAGKLIGGVSGGHDGSYLDALMLLNNWESGPSSNAIYHELAHHYYLHGPQRLKEGLANFLEAYTLAQIAGEGLEGRLTQLQAVDCGREDIQQHIDRYGGGNCDYHLGEQFILGMYLTLGREPVAAAIRDLHAQSMRSVYLNEETIFHAFHSNVPAYLEEAFRSVYLRYHGGPLAEPVHTEAQDLQALIALYNSTSGPQLGQQRKLDQRRTPRRLVRGGD